jgi:hypothetical protein
LSDAFYLALAEPNIVRDFWACAPSGGVA